MDIVSAIFTLIVLLLSIIIHEIAHGSVALYLGDPTAKNAGRLTLNPLKHLDPVGSFFLPLVLFLSGLPMFGWAKPVPVNPYNFRDQKYGSLKVALAGPGVPKEYQGERYTKEEAEAVLAKINQTKDK